MTVAPAPEWVQPLEIPEPSERRLTQIKGGIYYLLADAQTRWEPGQLTRYWRSVTKIVDRSGLEDAASFDESFDPATQQIFLHSIVVRRGDETIDLTRSTEFKTLQRETELESGILNGELTVQAYLEDVRVGDVVDYSFSITSKPKIFADDFASEAYTQWSVPLGVKRVRVTGPSNRPLQISANSEFPQPVRTDAPDGFTTYEWLLKDPDPIAYEDDVPDWRMQRGTLQVASFESWQQVADAEIGLYDAGGDLPPTFAAKVDAIAAQYTDPEDRLTEAFRLVQDEIRYVGLESGLGAFVPRPTSLVVSRGFGDCKDKTLLLLTALRRLRIEAHPALTDIEEARRLPHVLPSPYQFDHVIVLAKIGERDYWLDPTGTHQGGRGQSIVAPNYGFALPLLPHGSTLREIKQEDQRTPLMETVETYQFDGGDPALKLTVQTTYRKDEADTIRRDFASQSLDQISKQYQRYYGEAYPGIELSKPLQVDDDLDRNEVRVREYYRVSKQAVDANQLLSAFRFRASTLTNSISLPSAQERQHEVKLPYPYFRRHTVHLLNTPVSLEPPESSAIDTSYVSASVLGRGSATSMTVEWSLKVKQPELPNTELAELKKQYSDFSDVFYWTYDLRHVESDETQPDSDAVYGVIIIAVSCIIAVGLLLLIGGTIWGLRADRSYRGNGRYFPVSTGKYVLMSFVTLGSYPFFWLWKFWRWQKQHYGSELWPWARALFGVFFFYPAYKLANGELPQSRSVSKSFGIAMVVAGTIFYIIKRILARFDLVMDRAWAGMPEGFDGAAALFLMWTVGSLVLLGPLPAVIAVNRLNEEAPAILESNSKLNWWNISGIAYAAVVLVSLLISMAIVLAAQ